MIKDFISNYPSRHERVAFCLILFAFFLGGVFLGMRTPHLNTPAGIQDLAEKSRQILTETMKKIDKAIADSEMKIESQGQAIESKD